MAKLSANGIEVVRYRLTVEDEHFPVIREYSLRDNGWLLAKTKLTDGWTGWTRRGRFTTTAPELRAEAVRRWLNKGAVYNRRIEEV